MGGVTQSGLEWLGIQDAAVALGVDARHLVFDAIAGKLGVGVLIAQDNVEWGNLRPVGSCYGVGGVWIGPDGRRAPMEWHPKPDARFVDDPLVAWVAKPSELLPLLEGREVASVTVVVAAYEGVMTIREGRLHEPMQFDLASLLVKAETIDGLREGLYGRDYTDFVLDRSPRDEVSQPSATELERLLDSSHPHHSARLAAAVQAWVHLFLRGNHNPKVGDKVQLAKAVEAHSEHWWSAPESPTENELDRIAYVALPTHRRSGGAKPTPDKKA